MKRKAEPVRPGNPLRLTLAQHVHSAKNISRFSDKGGAVVVRRKVAATNFRAGPRDC